MKPLVSLAPFAFLSPAIAAAQSFPPGFWLKGKIGVEHYDFDTGNDTFGFGDVKLGYEFAPGGSAPRFGLRLDMNYLRNFDNSTSEVSQVLPWVYLRGNFGKISLGNTPVVTDSYLDRPRIAAGYALNDYEFSIVGASLLSSFRLNDGNDLKSLRYDQTFGDIKIGASYSRVDDTDDAYSLGMRYKTGNWRLGLAYESIDSTDFIGASVTGKFDNLTVKALYSQLSNGGEFNTASLGLKYRFTDAFAVGGTFTNISNGTSEDISTLYAHYKFSNGIFVNGGATTFNNDTFWQIGLGYKFSFGERPTYSPRDYSPPRLRF